MSEEKIVINGKTVSRDILDTLLEKDNKSIKLKKVTENEYKILDKLEG